MRITVFLLLVAGAVYTAHAQQRPVVSQYMYNGMVLNPAYAGSTNDFNASFMHRDQWVNIDGAPSFQFFSAHTPLFDNSIGVGLIATRDQIGAHLDHGFYATYAYKVRMSHGYLAMGLQGGFNNRVSNYNDLTLRDDNDYMLSGIVRKFSPNFGTGAYYYNSKMYVGISVPYLLKNNVYPGEILDSESRAPRYYYATGGIVLDLASNMKLLPSALIRYQANQPLGVDLNCNLIFDDVVYAGLSYRSGDSFSFLTQLVLNENIRVGYAYDILTSGQRQFTNGTHEIMLNYRILIKALSRDPLCPVYY